jgi:peptidoglycan-associated lipoprotein
MSGCQRAKVPKAERQSAKVPRAACPRTLPLAPWHIGTLVLCLLLSGACAGKRAVKPAPAARTLVVLLPEDDGAATSVRVSNLSGSEDLTAPYEATRVVGAQPPTPPATLERADVDREFGAVLAGLPPPAAHFNLYFRTDTADLTDESRALLPAVLRAVKSRTAPDITVIGHTDTTGSTGGNYRLGLERAAMVKKLLLATDLEGAAIEIESHGEADLLVKTRNNTAEPRNRRVEIMVK